MEGNIDKVMNDVPASNQVKEAENIYISEGSGKRVLFLGNSITLHGVAPQLGWYGNWGMAASRQENDYVHITIAALKQKDKNLAYCICNCSEWELNFYKEDSEKKCAAMRDFGADIIIVRVGENISSENATRFNLKSNLLKLINFVGCHAKIVATDLFWQCSLIDNIIKELAQENSWQFVTISDLGFKGEMKALNLYKSEGVSLHPSDLGMRAIARRIIVQAGKLI